MDAAILAVGTELLGTERLDTNSLRMADILRVYGVDLKAKSVAGDDAAEIARQLQFLMEGAQLILVSGGLGPTADDVTREAVAQCLGRDLLFEPRILEEIERRFAAFGWEMPEANRRQAFVIEGADVLPNANGSAPGLRLEADGRTLFLFPGVPGELEAMVHDYLEPWLLAHTTGARLEVKVLRVSCVSESSLEDQIAPVYAEFGRENISVLSSPGEIAIELIAAGAEGERRAQLGRMTARLQGLLGRALYSDGGFASLEEAVGSQLLAAGRTVVVAESCTGGLLAQRLTAVPGSSAYFLGGVVTYSNDLKTRLLGVSPETLERHGAVSRETAEAMAVGARQRLGGDFGLGITGIAGPDGGTVEKPAGTVHIALADSEGPIHRQFRFPGNRSRIRHLAAQWALELLRRRLTHHDEAARTP